MGSEAFLRADGVRIELHGRCWRKLVSGVRNLYRLVVEL